MVSNSNDTERGKLIIVIITAILTGVLFILIILVTLYVIAANVGYMYCIMIDAGSTSSKVSILKWRDWPFRINGYASEVVMKKVEPGISNFKDNPEEAFSRLEPTLKMIMQENIPQHQWSRTPLYLAATAGMRMINLENPLKAERIMESLRQNLPRIGAKVNNPYSDVRIMSGNDEGQNAWITVNYLAEKLGDETGNLPLLEEDMVGALDLGGASSQITFIPESKEPAPHTSIRYLFGREYTVYSHSLLCYGKSASQKRIWAMIIGSQTSPQILNPCLLRNHILNVTKAAVYIEPCVVSKFAVDIFGSELRPPVDLPDEVSFIGTGEPEKCREIINSIFKQMPCKREPCIFNGVYRPKLRGNFYAFAGFAFAVKFLKFPNGGTDITREIFASRVNEFCTKDWEVEKSAYSLKAHRFTPGYCMDGIYIDALLAGYGFTESDSWLRINFTTQVSDTTVSWALGYVVDATGMIESVAPRIHINFMGFILAISFLLVTCLLLAVVLVRRIRAQR